MVFRSCRVLRFLTVFALALAFSVPLSKPVSVRAAVLTVDTLTDEADGSCGDGDCSLRDAIALVNSNVGPDTIDFSVAGTITIDASLGCLPFLEDGGTTIDGTTAPGFAGTPVVAITAGVGLDCGITSGILIESDDNTLKGLAIESFPDDCVSLDDGSDNVIGPDMVLSDCYWGINIAGPATSNTVRDSFIGTNLAGTGAWGNVGAGIYLNHGPQVGGPTSTQILDNVISGNLGYGILLFGQNTQQNQIKGNYIGVAADGVTLLGNGSAGIRIEYGSHDNHIGGGLEGDGNIIAYNASMHPDTGIVIVDEGSDGNRISHNSIYDNTDLGIDLGDDGVTCDSGPSADEPNHFMPCPVIDSATTSLVSGTTCPNCIVEVFIADPDPSGYGEGRTFLGDTETTDGDFSVPVSGVEACDWITATAIGQNEEYGNTSEFALNVQVPCAEPTATPIHHRRTATPTEEPTSTPRPPTPTLLPLPVLTATPSSGTGPIVSPPATGEGPSTGGGAWTFVATLVGSVVAAIGVSVTSRARRRRT